MPHIDFSVQCCMDKGIGNIILDEFQVKSCGYREKHAKGSSGKGCSIGVLAAEMLLLVTSYYKAGLAFLKTMVLVKFVGVHPHAVKDLMAS